MSLTHADIANLRRDLTDRRAESERLWNIAVDALTEQCGALGHQFGEQHYTEMLDFRRNAECSGYQHTCSICGHREWARFTETPRPMRATGA